MSATRRAFLTAAGAACGLVASGGCRTCSGWEGRGLLRRAGAGERLNVALIGVGGRGAAHVSAVRRAGENVVALCDVDEELLAAGRALLGEQADGARLYTANGPSNDISVVDTASLTVVAKVAAGRSPWGIALVPR